MSSWVSLIPVASPSTRYPLARVPENAMKFAVGIMLTSFGLFWGAEGAGVSWPGNDASLLGLVPVVALVSLSYTLMLRQRWGTTTAAPVAQSPEESEGVAS